MRARIAALWVIPLVLVAAGFGTAWAAAVGNAVRYSATSFSPEPEFDWTITAGTVAPPLFLAGFAAALVTLAVHAVLWRPRA